MGREIARGAGGRYSTALPLLLLRTLFSLLSPWGLLCLVFITAAGLPAFADDPPAQNADDFSFYETRDDPGWVIPVSGRLSFETARQVGGPGRWIRL